MCLSLLRKETQKTTKSKNEGTKNQNKERMHPIVGCAACLLACGLIILLVGGIGYPISKHENEIFDTTTCKITEYLPLKTKGCTWCDEYIEYYTCCDSCNCNRDNICQTCCRTCSRSSCHYIKYTCSAAVWAVEYPTLDDDSCANPSRSSVRGDYQKSRGSKATDNSQDKALQDQRTLTIGSEYICYYNHNKCKEVKWKLSDPKAWLNTLISGGSIAGFGLLIILIAACIQCEVGTMLCECFSGCIDACNTPLKSAPEYVPRSPSAPIEDINPTEEIPKEAPPPFCMEEAPPYKSTNVLFKKV